MGVAFADFESLVEVGAKLEAREFAAAAAADYIDDSCSCSWAKEAGAVAASYRHSYLMELISELELGVNHAALEEEEPLAFVSVSVHQKIHLQML